MWYPANRCCTCWQSFLKKRRWEQMRSLVSRRLIPHHLYKTCICWFLFKNIFPYSSSVSCSIYLFITVTIFYSWFSEDKSDINAVCSGKGNCLTFLFTLQSVYYCIDYNISLHLLLHSFYIWQVRKLKLTAVNLYACCLGLLGEKWHLECSFSNSG